VLEDGDQIRIRRFDVPVSLSPRRWRGCARARSRTEDTELALEEFSLHVFRRIYADGAVGARYPGPGAGRTLAAGGREETGTVEAPMRIWSPSSSTCSRIALPIH